MAGHPEKPIAAAINDMAWLTGTWHGTHGADRIEEHWSAAGGAAMVGMFRALADAGPRFYELLTLDTEGAGLIFRFRHFDRALVSWEDRDAPLALDLVELTPERAVFLRRGARRWMTYRHDDGHSLAVFFEDEGGGHAPEEEYRFARG